MEASVQISDGLLVLSVGTGQRFQSSSNDPTLK